MRNLCLPKTLLELAVMNTLETNVFRIENPGDFSAAYHVYRVRGLSAEQEDYFRNLNILTLKLRREMRSPVCPLTRVDGTYVAIREGDGEPRSQHMLVR